MGGMEIALLGDQSLKIRGKKGSLLIDPVKGIPKTPTDAIVVLAQKDYDASRAQGARVVIEGPGDYEVSGIKISSLRFGSELMYRLTVDGIALILTTSHGLTNAQESQECSMLVVNAQEILEASSVTQASPQVLLLYGQNALDSAKAVNKEVQILSKYAVTAEKLPEEMQVVVLDT